MRRKSVGVIRPIELARGAALLVILLVLDSGIAQNAGARGIGDVSRTGHRLVADDRVAVILTPRQQAVLSAEVSGRVVAIRKELGQSFGPGEVLVQLDDLTYRINQRLAEARLEAAEKELAHIQKLTADQTRRRHAEAVLEAARMNLEATQRLYKKGHASLVDLENAKRDAKTAQAECELVVVSAAKELIHARREVVVAQGKRDLADKEFDACTIEAPYAGRVARVFINEHELVQHGTPVVEVVNDRVLLAKFLLPSSLFRSVRLGRQLELAVNETGKTIAVKVSHIAAVLDPASVTFEVYAEIDNADGNLRSGMNGILSLASIGRR